MKRAPSLPEFVADPVGRWLPTGSSVVWCASPSLGGATSFGSPDGTVTRDAMKPFAALWSPAMADRVDVILDTSLVERVEPSAVEAVIAFVVEHRARLSGRVRQQIGVVRRGIDGATLAGILPMVGDARPVRIVDDPRDAYRLVLGDAGEALCDEIRALVDAVSQVPPVLRALREVIRSRSHAIDLAAGARAVGVSARSLQRTLGEHGTSFREELRDVRFAEACQALATSDEKIAAIARRLGLSENALTQLFRERVGQTPGEYRRAAVATDSRRGSGSAR